MYINTLKLNLKILTASQPKAAMFYLAASFKF